MVFPTYVNPGEKAVLEKMWQCEGPSFRRILKSLPRPHPDPQLEWHLQLYGLYTKLKRSLEKRKKTPFLSEEDLKDLGIIRGADLNIDDTRPIDLEPRFFLPAPPNISGRYVRLYKKNEEKWPEHDPEDLWDVSWYAREPGFNCMANISNALWNMIETGRYYTHPFLRREAMYSANPTGAMFQSGLRGWMGASNKIHRFWLERSLYYRGPGRFETQSDISHTMAFVMDTLMPDDRILRSEMLLAVILLRHNLAMRYWPEHHTHPILVFSFYATGCRILQMHVENKNLHVRVSRRLNLLSPDGSLPRDARVALRWLLAKPMGKTFFSDDALKSHVTREANATRHKNPGATSTLRIPMPGEFGKAPA